MTSRRWMLCALAALATASAAAGERIERFLPATTFMYGGVERLEEGFDKVMDGLRRALPGIKEFEQEQLLRELADALDIEGAETREQFVAATGLDRAASAGIAWVLGDPTYDPGRNLNENVLLILPVRDVAAAERLLAAELLPDLPMHSAQLCRSGLQRIHDAKRRWERAHPGVEKDLLTWDDLATAVPGLKPLRCPCGGDYAVGRPGQQPVCSVHGEGDDAPRFRGPFTREGLGVRKIGDATLVGGRAKGAGYALTASHVLFSNNMNVLEDALHAAAGEAPRADVAAGPVGDADGRAYVNVAVLMGMLRHELARDLQRRGPTPAAGRLLMLLAGAGGLSGDLRVGGDVRGTLSWTIHRNAESAKVLATQPSKLEALALVPDTALAAWGANLARETFGFLGDIGLAAEPELAAPCKLVMAACDGDGAFALMPGALMDEMPNLLFVLKVRDRETAQAAAETWLTLFARQFRPRERDGAKPLVRRHELDGVELWSAENLRHGAALHYGFVGPYAVFASRLGDVRGVIALQRGQARNALVASERYRKLGLPDAPANVVSFVDMPALIGQIAAGEHARRQKWQNEACRNNMRQIEQLVAEFRKRHKRLPENFVELRQRGGRNARERQIRDWCMLFGQQTKLLLDPRTGKVSCPAHGTVENFRVRMRDEPPPPPNDEVRILSAFGVWALRIRVAGDRIVADGRLVPAPQPNLQPRPDPPRPVGPAEF